MGYICLLISPVLPQKTSSWVTERICLVHWVRFLVKGLSSFPLVGN